MAFFVSFCYHDQSTQHWRSNILLMKSGEKKNVIKYKIDTVQIESNVDLDGGHG